MPSQVYNPTPIDLTGMSHGMVFTIPAGKRMTIRTERHANERISDEDIVQNLMIQLGRRGLCVVDPDNPIPVDQQRRVSLRALADSIRENLKFFNDANIKLAAENHATYQPTRELLREKKVLDAIEAVIGKPDADIDFVTAAELGKLADKSETNAIAVMLKMQSLMETGASNEQIQQVMAEWAKKRQASTARAAQAGALSPFTEAEPETQQDNQPDEEADLSDPSAGEEPAPDVTAMQGAAGPGGPSLEETIIEPIRTPGQRIGVPPTAARRKK
jgi:hypothetical protein